MRSNYDTYRQRRLEILQDLQKYSRRANGIAPIANYEDIGIIRNTIRPALELDKFASVEVFPDPAQLTLILDLGGLDKLAGFWGDVWEGMKGGAGRLWGGIKTLGTDVLWPVVKLPYTIPKSIYEHVTEAWRPDSSFLSNLGRSTVGTLSGILEPVEDIASGIYRSGRDIATGALGSIPGVELGFQKAMRTPYLGSALRTADTALESLARIAPGAALMFLPGGQVSGLARIGVQAAKAAPVVEGLLRQWPHTGGGIGEGLRATLMGQHEGPAPSPQALPQGQIQPMGQFSQPMDQLGQEFASALSRLSPNDIVSSMLPGVTLEQLRGFANLIGQMPRGMLVPAG